MKGTGPRPVAKKPTKPRTEIADRTLISKRRDRASRSDMVPIPEIERRRQAFRPILSARGAQEMVVTRLTIEMRIVTPAEE